MQQQGAAGAPVPPWAGGTATSAAPPPLPLPCPEDVPALLSEHNLRELLLEGSEQLVAAAQLELQLQGSRGQGRAMERRSPMPRRPLTCFD